MAQLKISEYPAKTTFNDGDLYDVSTYDGISAYTSEKLTFAQLKAELNSALNFVSSNLYNADGTLTSDRTVTMGGNTINFDGGNVGIGLSSPSEKLHVNGNARIDGKLSINEIILPDYQFVVGGVSRMKERLDFGFGTTTGGAIGKITFNPTTFRVIANGSNPLSLETGTGDVIFNLNSAERARFTTTGLGIGISNPSEKLHVNGNARVDGDYNIFTKTLATYNSGNDRIIIGNSTSAQINILASSQTNFGNVQNVLIGNLRSAGDANAVGITFGSAATTYFTDYDFTNGINHLFRTQSTITSTGAKIFEVRNNTTTLFTIDKDGNTGIGLTTPSEKLHVNGKIRTDSVFNISGTDGFTGTGAYTNFTIVGGIITAAS